MTLDALNVQVSGFGQAGEILEVCFWTVPMPKEDEGRNMLAELVWWARRKRTAFLGPASLKRGCLYGDDESIEWYRNYPQARSRQC